MKKLIAVAFVALGAISAALAQDTTTLMTGTQATPIGASNTTTTVAMTKSDDAVVYGSFKLTGAGTSGVLFRLDTSADNVNWNTGVATYWKAANGTTAVELYTNFTTLYPYVRFQLHNTNSVAATNWTLKVVTKKKFI